jgi:hypothetical protein
MLGTRRWQLMVGCWLAVAAGVVDVVRAEGTHGNDTLVMTTFLIDEGVEGLATLDALTGELKVFVLNPKSAKFSMAGKRIVLTDLKVAAGKKVSFLMVPGKTRFAGAGGAGAVVAPGVLYVMDGNTGKFACYGIAYPPGALATGVEAALEITPLDANAARTIKLDP